MAKLKLSSRWWTAPTESESGRLIVVTGRGDMDNVIATGKYNDRIEVTWRYEPDSTGMPGYETSKLMGEISDALMKKFDKDQVAVMTGIYTGDGERNWIFYSLNPRIFGFKFNEVLAPYELLPITIYVEKDPEWAEYREMCDLLEVETED